MSKSPIDAFMQFSALVGESTHNIQPAPNPIIGASGHSEVIEYHCGLIRELQAEQTSFFSQFDYSWAVHANNYSHVLEAQLQYFLLRVIAEISPAHPDYNNLTNLCVRLLPSSFINAEAAIYADYKFITISTSLVKMMQAWGLVIPKVATIGKSLGETGELVCFYNDFHGRDAEKALRYEWGQCQAPIDLFLDRIQAYVAGGIPQDTAHIGDYVLNAAGLNATESRVVDLAVDQWALAISPGLLLAAEMFFVCHEVVHLIKHPSVQQARLIREELEADHGAGSLMIIFQASGARRFAYGVDNKSRFDEMYQALFRTPALISAAFSGPAMFFSTLQSILSVQMMKSNSESRANIKSELELNRRRMAAFDRTVASYGLDLISLAAAANLGGSVHNRSGLGMTYPGALQQFDVFNVAVRRRLLERAGLSGDTAESLVNFDNNLFRGFSGDGMLDIRARFLSLARTAPEKPGQ